MTDGLGADAAGEDRFDCVLGVLCVLNVLAGNRPDDAPAYPWISAGRGGSWANRNAIGLAHCSRRRGSLERKGAPDWTRPRSLW